MKKGLLHEKIQGVKEPSVPWGLVDSIVQIQRETINKIKSWWNSDSLYKRGKDKIKEGYTWCRDSIAEIFREHDHKIAGPLAFFRTRILGLLYGDEGERVQNMKDHFPEDSLHPEDKHVKDMEPLMAQLEESLKQIKAAEESDSLTEDTEDWVKKRMETGVNLIRAKYGPGRNVDLHTRAKGPSKIQDYTKALAYQALKQGKGNPEGMPPLNLVAVPPIPSGENETIEQYEARLKPTLAKRNQFSSSQVVFLSSDPEQSLTDAAAYLRELGPMLNDENAKDLYVATFQEGGKFAVAVVMTGVTSMEPVDEDLASTADAIDDFKSLPDPFWEGKYKAYEKSSIAAQYAYKKYADHYPACVIGELETALRKKFKNNDVVQISSEIARDVELSGRRKASMVIMYDLVLPGERGTKKRFQLMKNGMIRAVPNKQRAQQREQRQGGSQEVTMTWQEFLKDISPEGEARYEQSIKAQDGIRQFDLEESSFEHLTTPGTRTLKKRAVVATPPGPEDYLIPFESPMGLDSIEILDPSGARIGTSLKKLKKTATTDPGSKNWGIDKADIAAIVTGYPAGIMLEIHLKSGLSFVIPTFIIKS